MNLFAESLIAVSSCPLPCPFLARPRSVPGPRVSRKPKRKVQAVPVVRVVRQEVDLEVVLLPRPASKTEVESHTVIKLRTSVDVRKSKR